MWANPVREEWHARTCSELRQVSSPGDTPPSLRPTCGVGKEELLPFQSLAGPQLSIQPPLKPWIRKSPGSGAGRKVR